MERHSHTQTYLPTNTCLSVVAWDLSDFLQDNPFKPSLNSWLFSVLSSNMLCFAAVNCSAADLRRKYSLCELGLLSFGSQCFQGLCFLDSPPLGPTRRSEAGCDR